MLQVLTLFCAPQEEPVAKKKKRAPGKASGKSARTPNMSAQKAKAAMSPVNPMKTPAQLLPCSKPLQPRSSAQAKAAASAMQKALSKEDAGAPAVGRTETPAGKQWTSRCQTAACTQGPIARTKWPGGFAKDVETSLRPGCLSDIQYCAPCMCHGTSLPPIASVARKSIYSLRSTALPSDF